MATTRNLVVGCDGTWNEPEQRDDGTPAPSNVVKFMNALYEPGDGSVRRHYEEGVGSRKWEALRGGIYGYGLEKRILGAYRFLQARYTDDDWPPEQNRLFLIGFSRGAYTARRISGLLAHSGVPRQKKDVQLGWELYQQRDEHSMQQLKAEGRFFDVQVEMIGVWDTVKSTNDDDYHDDRLAANVAAGYHAMAIDEQRLFFPVLKWRADPRATQVWFPGVHSDVGGGYADCGLADVALEWMIYRAMQHGLDFDEHGYDANVHPVPGAARHDSLQGIWQPLGRRRRRLPPTALIHKSAQQQGADYVAQLPQPPNWWRRGAT